MEDYPPEMQHFVDQEGIEVLHYRTEGNKEPFVEVNPEDISQALVKLLDKRSHPGKLPLSWIMKMYLQYCWF